jgi:hypothetical protein
MKICPIRVFVNYAVNIPCLKNTKESHKWSPTWVEPVSDPG